MSFAENLRDMLTIRNIDLKELSLGTGISKSTLDNYLSSQKSLPNAENAVKIARYMGTTVETLVLGKAEPLKKSTSEYLTDFLHDLNYLKKSDFDAIRAIVKSLAGR